MTRHLRSASATLGVMVALDLVWLGLIARPIYLAGIGHLMAEQPDLAVAGLFYLVFAGGLLVFAVAPSGAAPGWRRAAVRGGLFGFFAYATYDLTNLATLRDWPAWLSALDIAWGITVSAISAAAGRAAFDRGPAG